MIVVEKGADNGTHPAEKNRILLVLPVYGFTGDHVRHPPLSLLYAAAEARRAGYVIDLLDCRLHVADWRDRLAERLGPDTLLVGISVMLGHPILSALEISAEAKRLRSGVPVVWGGTFPSMLPEQVLAEPLVDFVVCGYGARALRELADALTRPSPEFAGVTGLVSRDLSGGILCNPPLADYEHVPFRDIPYDLIADDLPRYTMLHGGTTIFPLYGSYGCPYRCGFCISPACYRSFSDKWRPVPPEEVVEHMAFLQATYGATFFYLYDDDPCCRPEHLRAILTGVQRRGLRAEIGFRSLRVNEVLALTDDDFVLLQAAGVHVLHVGVESGAPACLERMEKGITVEQSLAANRRLAAIPGLRVGYHFLTGIPDETPVELAATLRFIEQLERDNPRAFFFYPNKYIPTPGTAMYAEALARGFVPPAGLRAWGNFDTEEDFPMPWDTPATDRWRHLVQLAAVTCGNMTGMLWQLNRRLAIAYAVVRACYLPLLRWRMRYGCTAGLVEYRLLGFVRR